MRILIFIFILSIPIKTLGDECQTWFKEKNFQLGETCFSECMSSKKEMCSSSSQCIQLCKTKKSDSAIQLEDIISEITEAEINLFFRYPVKILRVFNLSREAEGLCETLFKHRGADDPSDACRHFIWSAFLYADFGLEFSQEILNFHEEKQASKSRSKDMDLANNQLGLMSAKELLEKNQFSRPNVLKAFQDSWKEGRLVILRK